MERKKIFYNSLLKLRFAKRFSDPSPLVRAFFYKVSAVITVSNHCFHNISALVFFRVFVRLINLEFCPSASFRVAILDRLKLTVLLFTHY